METELYQPHNILMTGCCGFIGSNVVNYLCHKYKNLNFINLDRLDYCADLDNIEVDRYSNYRFYKGDIKNRDLVDMILREHKIDTVIHFAAQTHVDNSFINSLQFTIDNVYGSHTLFNCANAYGKIKKFIHISTDEVYGEVDIDHQGCDEKSLMNPTNPYSATKACAEFIGRSYYHSFKFPIVIVRSNNVFGPRQYPEKVIPNFIYRLLDDKKCQIHGKGTTRRNFIYVQDFARAIETILFRGEIMKIYNIGTPEEGFEYSVLDLAKMLIQTIKGPDAKMEDWIEFVDDRNFNDFRYCINSQTLRQLGWKESFTFQEGLAETVNWYKIKYGVKPPNPPQFLQHPLCF